MPSPRNRPRPLAESAAALVAGLFFLAVAASGDRLGTWRPALLIGLGLVLALAVAALGRALLRGRRTAEAEDEAPPRLDPVVLAQAAEQQSAKAREYIEKIRDAARRQELQGELARLDEGRLATSGAGELDVVVFGTVSAGKTSLVNALLGREVGRTGAVMGTTREGENHVYTLEAAEGVVRLVDTPGLAEAGPGGAEREQDARRLAERADLLLFVVDHDLIRREYAALLELARLGKRSIVVLNKKDRFPDADLAAIRAKLRERLEGVVPADDVVTIAAAPRPLEVRERLGDGTSRTVFEIQEPDVQPLRDHIAAVLADEGRLLRLANLLLKTKNLGREAESALGGERDRKCRELVDHYQWVTATTVFANPVPALNLVQGAAVQLDLIADLARVYDLNPSPVQLRALAAKLVQAMLKAGLAEAASSVVAGVFKRTPMTFVAAGAVQAVTMAYLARIAGEALADYFREGESWGPGGVEGAVLRRFEANSRADFLQEFARQAFDRVLSRVWSRPAAPESRST